MLQRHTAFTWRKFWWRKDFYTCLIGIKLNKIFAGQKKPELKFWVELKKLDVLCFVFCTVDKKVTFYEFFHEYGHLKFSREMKITTWLRLICFKGWGQNSFPSWNPRAFIHWKSCRHIETLPTQPWSTRFIRWIQKVWNYHPSDSPLPHYWVFAGFSSSESDNSSFDLL